MNNRIFIGPRSVQPGGHPGPQRPGKSGTGVPEGTFQEMLERARAQAIKLSGHAQQRLAKANRTLSEEEMTQLARAVDRAAAKGSRDALVLMRDLALVVSVKNRTVITAVDGNRIRENIFTNIDSAVILSELR